MEERGEQEDLADAAIHFALISYAAGAASSRYVALLRERQEAESSSRKTKKEKERD